MYHHDHFAYSFSENRECFKQERLFCYLHRTKHAILSWTFKTAYTHGKVTITKYSSEQTVQMENILTQLLHGKLICHKTKVFVNYYLYTQGRKHCQHMFIFICLLIIISTCIQDPDH